MAVYKVPQDVEAEDKLIGPFSFRQFIYLIVAALGGLFAFLLSKIFIGLIILPLPVIALFAILALPLRKDQPMETYLTAVIRFFLKPRKRIWDPEGAVTLVQIVAPKKIEYSLTKDISGSQASQQLSYLAQVVDTQGWSTRGVITTQQGMNDIIVAEAQATEDILDDKANIAQSFDQRINQADEARRQSMLQQFQQAAQQATPAAPIPPSDQTPTATEPVPVIDFNPYPKNMRQHVISPTGSGPQKQATDTPTATSTIIPPTTDSLPSDTANATGAVTPSPDIIRLANNNDLSVSALAREAHRLENDGQEVEISLR